VHERLAVVAMFAYSRAPLVTIRRERFDPVSRWRFLEKVIFDIPERSATHALIDLAGYFRALDDEEAITPMWMQTGGAPIVGTLHLKDESTEPLTAREMSNKIIHAKRVEWDFANEPKAISFGRDRERWVRLKSKSSSCCFSEPNS
jgi:hypothetical protein